MQSWEARRYGCDGWNLRFARRSGAVTEMETEREHCAHEGRTLWRWSRPGMRARGATPCRRDLRAFLSGTAARPG